jgi:two-component system, sensor histidine kinase PdtaS
MTALVQLARTRTETSDRDLDHLRLLVGEWSLIADLAISDLVLWLPTWNDAGLIAGAHVRPSTGPTIIPEDLVGTFVPRGRQPLLDRALSTRSIVTAPAEGGSRSLTEAVPIVRDGRAVAVVERRAALDSRPIGRLEDVYLAAADDLLSMVARGEFPEPSAVAQTEAPPRAGDGLIRVDRRGNVVFASPNAVSAFHRLGLAVDLEGGHLPTLTSKLVHRPGPVNEALTVVASGSATGGADVENSLASVTLRSLPLRRDGVSQGALVLVRDVTDLRRRDRALLTKDATIREVHHRVKNNLQTVAALLRLQARRTTHPETRIALDEAVRRVAAIGVVHETLANAANGDEHVDFDEVSDRLISLVLEYSHPTGDVSVRREGSVGALPGTIATPLSVIVTELLHNAIEHGIGARPSGRVLLRGHLDERHVVVSVEDDGPGAGPEGPVEGLGLQIVRTLVEDELGGVLTLQSQGGFQASVQVPLASAGSEGSARGDV